MKFTITGTVMQTVNMELAKGERVYSEAGNMSWMSANILMETNTKGGIWRGIKRRLSGETFFLNTFTCETGTGIVTFASEFPGKIMHLPLDGRKSFIIQKDAFMCAQEGVDLDLFVRRKMGVGFFGGEGFILQKLSGKGHAFVEFDGEITEITLQKDQDLLVDTGHLAMYEPSVSCDLQLVSGVKNIFVGGEGLFLARMTGPGKVWLQSMTLANLAGKIGNYLRYGRSAGGSGRGVSGFFGGLGGNL